VTALLAVAGGYLAIGAAAAVGWRRSPLDAVLLVALWPLYGPVLLVATDRDGRERALLAALRRAAATPLRAIVPDEVTGRALVRRRRDAAARLRAIDAVLARPAAAALPAGALDRVHRLRGRLHAQLEEAEQLITQLTALADVVHVTGGDAAVADCLCELTARIETLDPLMADDGALDPVDSTSRAPSPGGR
jgi:hypothetical protein